MSGAAERETVSEASADGSPGDPPSTRRVSVIGAWLAFFGACVFLDGWVGGAVAVVVAAVVAARLPTHLLGALGAAAVVGALASVLVDGVPSEAEVSPAFVTRSLVPHHLTFAAFVCVGAWVVFETVRYRRTAAPSRVDDAAPGPPSRPVAMVVVASTAVAAMAACAAVLWG